MSQLLFDIVDTELLKKNSTRFLNRSFEYISKSVLKLETGVSSNLIESIFKASSAQEVNENSLSWFALSLLKAINQEGKIDLVNLKYVENVFSDILLNENNLDLKVKNCRTAGLHYAIPLNLSEKLKFKFDGWETFQQFSEYEKWEPSLSKSIDLINSINPNILSDLNYLIENILTVYSKSESHGSMSPKNITGTIFLPDVNDFTLLAECIVHEALHQYLYRLEHSSSLFNDNEGIQELYYSPWKEEPRPLIMVLHGAFVFTGVILFYQSLCSKNILPDRQDIFRERLSYRYYQVKIAIEVLLHNDKLTAFGKNILTIMNEYICDVSEGDLFSTIDLSNILGHKKQFSRSNYIHVSI